MYVFFCGLMQETDHILVPQCTTVVRHLVIGDARGNFYEVEYRTGSSHVTTGLMKDTGWSKWNVHIDCNGVSHRTTLMINDSVTVAVHIHVAG